MFFIYTVLGISAAFLLSHSLFAPALALSHKIKALDMPNQRKIHTQVIARGGGFMFFAPFVILVLIMPLESSFKIGLAIGGTVTFLVGFWDDAISLSPFQKLAGQSLGAAVYILIRGSSGILSGIALFCWLVFLENAINLCDGLDGLASGISASQSVCLFAISIFFRNFDALVCLTLLLGVILGFLPRNFPNAKIFMGDCGALFLGFVLGALSAELILGGPWAILVLSAYLIFRIPIADATFSFFRRAVRRKNPFAADQGHFHHRLLAWGFTKECATLALITATLFFGLLGVLLVWASTG